MNASLQCIKLPRFSFENLPVGSKLGDEVPRLIKADAVMQSKLRDLMVLVPWQPRRGLWRQFSSCHRP